MHPYSNWYYVMALKFGNCDKYFVDSKKSSTNSLITVEQGFGWLFEIFDEDINQNPYLEKILNCYHTQKIVRKFDPKRT